MGHLMLQDDNFYMKIALEEAKKGLGFTSPNPMVGAVIVKNNKILSSGYHEEYGKAHAEANAINKLTKEELKDSTIFVTLEPCCHYGNTPPCTDLIINSGIKKVVIASKDTDERVAGKSLSILNKHGIETVTGIMEKEALELNSIYFFYKAMKRPYIVLKAALTLDGKIATASSDSKWISNDKSRDFVHYLRARLNSIAVGKNTVIQDEPKLNCRHKDYKNKLVNRLLFSNSEEILSKIKTESGKNYLITSDISESKEKFITFCLKNNIDSILIEGGGRLYTWFLENNLVDRIFLFYKPSFLGSDGVPVYTKQGESFIKNLKEFQIVKTEKIDNNFMVELTNGEPICLQV